ncbi:unnamed protein product [Prunus armeniaca]
MKRREEMAKDKIAEAQEAIRERNALLLQEATLAREVDELKEKMTSSESALAEAEQKKAKEIACHHRSRASCHRCAACRGLKAFPALLLNVISIPWVRQSLAIGVTELISVWAADIGNLTHDPVSQLEGTRFHPGVVVPGYTLFIGGVVHYCLVTKFFNEVKVQGQLPIVGFSVISGGSVYGLTNLYQGHDFGTKGKKERCLPCGGMEGGAVGPENLWE